MVAAGLEPPGSTLVTLWCRSGEGRGAGVRGARVDGKVLYHGQDLYTDEVDPVAVRRQIGMVFQKPNPFPKSIYDNIAWGARINGFKGNMDDLVEQSLRQAALWDEVK